MKLSGVEIDLLFARLSSMTEAAMVTGGKTVETLDLASLKPFQHVDRCHPNVVMIASWVEGWGRNNGTSN